MESSEKKSEEEGVGGARGGQCEKWPLLGKRFIPFWELLTTAINCRVGLDGVVGGRESNSGKSTSTE